MVTRIAITQREIENSTYPETRDTLAQDWVVYLEALFPSAAVLPIPNRISNSNQWLDLVDPDLIILSNGNDWGTSATRDLVETNIVAAAERKKVPTLFVCRGFQVLNALSGTVLAKNLQTEVAGPHVACRHLIDLRPGAFRDRAKCDQIEVNSYHNQGVLLSCLDPAGPLVPFAVSADGVLEGCYHQSNPFLGIQWHPERPGGPSAFDAAIITDLATKGVFW